MHRRRADPLLQPQSDPFAYVPPPPAPVTAGPIRLTFVEDGRRLEVQVERSARTRRTIMRVDAIAKTVVVTAPVFEPMTTVERFVRSRLAWALAALQGLVGGRATDTVDIEHAGETLTIVYEPSARAHRVALRVDPRTGHVKLVVPPRMARAQALDFARQHAGWIAARLKRRLTPVHLADGSIIPVFDVPHRIRHRPGARGTVWVEADELHVAGYAEHVSRRVSDWLGMQLRAQLVPLVHDKAKRIERQVAQVVLRDTATQWGSCAKSGVLCFSLRLAFAPREVVDYVAAHEVAHLVHHNHSARFWALAQKLTAGDMAACKDWLRRNGQSLMRYG